MRVLVAGATGAIGERLVPRLVEAGHEVVATTRSPDRVDQVRRLGAEPAVVDGLDRDAVVGTVTRARPEVVVHQMSSLRGFDELRRFDDGFRMTNRLRTEGTVHLLEAARAAGTRRLIAQSFTGWPNAREGAPVKTEEDPLDPYPPAQMRETLDAIRTLESLVVGATGLEGLVLRYGAFYGPGSAHPTPLFDAIRRRRLPIIGDGTGVWSWIHIDDAAAATALAIDHGTPGPYNIVDDDPAPVSAWAPYVAELMGAQPPRHVPVWLGRLAGGEVAVSIMTRIRGSSNAKARRELGWAPRYRSWREGFAELLAPQAERARREAA